MKRILLVSMCVIASIVLFSCTDDTMETSQNTIKEQVVAEGSGEPIPIPPPKP
jgi:hypothetical protein